MSAEELRRLLQTDVFDIDRAAKFLGIKPDSVEAAADRGRLPYVWLHRKKLFLRADLEEYRRLRGRGRGSKVAQAISVRIVPDRRRRRSYSDL